MNSKNISITLILAVLTSMGLFWSCSEDEEFSKDYDINWPVPTVTDVSPSEQAMIDSEVTISGTGLDKILSVTIDGKTCQVISTSEGVLKIKLPRKFSPSPISITNHYRQTITTEASIAPVYPEVTITALPSTIEKNQVFVIEGANVDLITSVKIGDQVIAVNGTNANSLSIQTKDLGLQVGDVVTIEVSSTLTEVVNGTVSGVEIVEPSDFFEPVAPVILFDFEDGENVFQNGDIATENGINLGGLSHAGRGEKYFSLMVESVPDAWGTWLGGLSSTNIDVSEFHEPHITFLVNTNGQEGNFQLAVQQDGIKGGLNFTKPVTGVDGDDYKFKTNGWEWRSVSLERTYDDWGSGSFTLDKNKIIEEIQLSFKQGNGSNPFEIHIDQVMITDGKVIPLLMLMDFENGSDPWENNSGASHGINLSGISPISGNYYTVQKSGVDNWDWTGAVGVYESVDLASAVDPHLNLWVHTNGKQGFFQIEMMQNDVKWGASVDTKNYLLDTEGEWKLYSWRLSELGFDNWGGSGSATELDTTEPIDYIKLGFSTGNVSGEYEMNIDNLTLTDGPMF